VAIVASGDLSHCLKSEGPYEFAAEGPVFDEQVTAAMASGDFMRFLTFKEAFCQKAGECGLRSFIVMAGTMDRKEVEAELLSYEGPFGVGYGVAAFKVKGDDPERCFGDLFQQDNQEQLEMIKQNEDAYVKLARQSLEAHIRGHKRFERPDNLAEDLIHRRAGVFVSLKKEGKLRGCIGTIEPTTASVAEEIIQNAVSAGVGDLRFEPVTEEELDELVYSVDVLGNAEPVHSMEELDAKRYGVIVIKGGKRGLLLPNLEGVDTPEQQIAIALEKAGLSPEEKYKIERFEVVRHKGYMES